MDFVVVGFGLGALGVLLGVVMLGVAGATVAASRGARLRAGRRGPPPSRRGRASRDRAGLLYAGGAMLLATVAALAGSLDDRTGAFLVTTTATVAAVGILLAGTSSASAIPRHRAAHPFRSRGERVYRDGSSAR